MKNYSSQNSSISKYLWVLLFLFTTTVSLAQEANKTIRGKVTDDVTKQPIVGAVVTIKNSDPLKGTTTDANGAFKLTGISVGRVTLEITFLGYEKLTIPDIVVTAGKEVVLDLAITESITSTADVVVTYNRKEDLSLIHI